MHSISFLNWYIFISIIVSLNFNIYPAFGQLGFVNFLSCFEVDRIYVAFHLFLKTLCLLLQLISPAYLLYPLICTRSIESGLITFKEISFLEGALNIQNTMLTKKVCTPLKSLIPMIYPFWIISNISILPLHQRTKLLVYMSNDL